MEAEPEPQRHKGEEDSLDSDGYDKHDPYSGLAKRLDKRAKVIEDFEERPLIKVSNKILE